MHRTRGRRPTSMLCARPSQSTSDRSIEAGGGIVQGGEYDSLFQSKNEPEGSCWRGQLQASPFWDFFIYVSQLSWRWECGNRFYRFPRFVGRAENSTIVFRPFHQ